jgi:hypothetical protein
MRAELVLMGRRVDMALQSRRRGLVVGIYAAMAAMMAGLWFVDHWHSTATYLYWIMLLACRLFLGGYYRGGLVKPFSNKPPRERVEPHPFLALGLRVYRAEPADDERTFRNDERELQQRDHAHYQAYQGIGYALVALWITSYIRMLKPGWMQWAGMSWDQVFYGLTMALMLVFFTVPQAILLWTEPDMEEAG